MTKNQVSEDKTLTEKDLYNTQDKRMIVRTGTMSMEVDKYDETESKVKDIVKGFGGYVTNTSSTLNANGKKQGSVTIRVASDKFDAAIAEISKIGKVMNQNITGKDVTAEYIDADARVKTQKELESRLLKLLSEKTAKLTDVVEVEQKLSQVREVIEQTEGRMRYLKDQASYSTLTISIYEPGVLVISTGGGFFYEIGEAFSKGMKGFTSVLGGIITVIIALLPLIILALIIIYLAIKYFKRRKTLKIQAEVKK
jgi:histone deacetylase complex regulatory component SIN3